MVGVRDGCNGNASPLVDADNSFSVWCGYVDECNKPLKLKLNSLRHNFVTAF